MIKMKIKLELNPKYKEIELHICNEIENEQVKNLYRTLKNTLEVSLVAYLEDEKKILSSQEIIRIYSQNKNVYVTTAQGDFRLRERLYELEERLDSSQFIRISNSEIVNIKKIERLDTSITGTIRMYLKEEVESYVSRRYVSKIKQALGILFALLGVNGAGKTTTIKMLSGLTKPTNGDAIIEGYSVTKELDKVKRIINVSPQEIAVAGNLTVRENLEFIARLYFDDRKKVTKKVQEMIELFSLQEVEKSRAKTLSGGWQRKLSIAMALITEPKILFLDEPTSGLDVLARQNLWRIIRALKGKITIILTTHYMEEAESLSDEVACMIQGELREIGSVEELTKRTGTKILEEAFIAIAGEE